MDPQFQFWEIVAIYGNFSPYLLFLKGRLFVAKILQK
jgi:hypothetical protein